MKGSTIKSAHVSATQTHASMHARTHAHTQCNYCRLVTA